MKFLNKTQNVEIPASPNTLIGIGSSSRGTLMVSGTLRIEGDLEGDILNCERLEVGQHGLMRADIEVKEAVVEGRVQGNIRALGVIELKSGSHVEGDIAATSVIMEPGVFFSGRCTMLEAESEAVALGADLSRVREHVPS
jgi:cytoskeletal protein CcmA (bactofilin family)